MTAGTSRLQKTEAVDMPDAVETDPSKELINNLEEIKLTSTGADFEELTNDEGDVFYQPTLTISSKLSTKFEGKFFNETINT